MIAVRFQLSLILFERCVDGYGCRLEVWCEQFLVDGDESDGSKSSSLL